MSTGLFMNRTLKPQGIAYRAHQERQRRALINQFAEAIAETGTVTAAAKACGISIQYGSQLLRRIKDEINVAQRAAGFGDWA